MGEFKQIIDIITGQKYAYVKDIEINGTTRLMPILMISFLILFNFGNSLESISKFCQGCTVEFISGAFHTNCPTLEITY